MLIATGLLDERTAIEAWLVDHATSPLTGVRHPQPDTVPLCVKECCHQPQSPPRLFAGLCQCADIILLLPLAASLQSRFDQLSWCVGGAGRAGGADSEQPAEIAHSLK